MTPVGLSDSFYLHFGTSSATTGAATNADSTPTVTIEEDGAAMGYAPTVTNVSTGLYRVQIDATAGNGFEAGKRYSAYVTATVGGITGKDGIGEFEVLATDLNAGVASVQGNVTGSVASVSGAVTVGAMNADTITAGAIAAGAITSSEAPALANLDAAVSTRLATASYTAPDNAGIAATLAAVDTEVATILAAVDTEVGAIKAKTDQLAFTVANQVDANVQSVNEVTVTGDGQPGTEWGPP